ncbi:MAG: DNA-processing protein DprA [Armatimonadota bacterium]|nr:DNA-processing protein DprA [Armatimonadota bacterium]
MRADIDLREDFELALCLAPKVGSETFRHVLNRKAALGLSDEEIAVLPEDRLRDDLGVPAEAAKTLSDKSSHLYDKLRKFKESVGTKNVRLLTAANVLYPSRVAEFCPSPPAYLFAYGNLRALASTTFAVLCSRDPSPADLENVERAAEQGVLSSKVLVGGTNTDAYQRAAVVPLRWGAPRILVLDRGLFVALGSDLSEEPFRTARLWRYRFDAETDLVLSRNRPFDEYAPPNQKYRDELLVAMSDEVHGISLRPGGTMDKLSKRAETLGRPVIRT